MKRILAAVTMAAAALATLGLAGPGAAGAGASSHAAAGPVGSQYAKGEAGYHMYGHGWRFRYLETTLTVPAAATRAKSAQIALANMGWGPDYVYLNVTSGGGPGSISYGIGYDVGAAKTLAVTPSAGDQVKISIFYDRATAQNHFTAVDLSTGAKATAVEPFQNEVIEAWVFGSGPAWSFASSTTRLWAFTDTHLTSYSGARGAIFGPWDTYRVVGTRGGAPDGAPVLWPHYPWNNSQNFGVWWRAAS